MEEKKNLLTYAGLKKLEEEDVYKRQGYTCCDRNKK